MMLQHWRSTPPVCDVLFDLPFLDHVWLRDLLAGRREAQATTMAFLANMLAAATVIGA